MTSYLAKHGNANTCTDRPSPQKGSREPLTPIYKDAATLKPVSDGNIRQPVTPQEPPKQQTENSQKAPRRYKTG